MNKYLAEVKGDSKVLRGPVEMDEPVCLTSSGDNLPDWYLEEQEKYNSYLASLPIAFTNVEWLTNSDNGRLLEEGKDFKIKSEWKLTGCKDDYDGAMEKYKISIAVPIDKQEKESTLSSRLKKWLKTVDINDVIKEFEEMGYQFVDIEPDKQEEKTERMFTEKDMLEWAQWLNDSNWGEKETWGRYDPPSYPTNKQLLEIFLKNK